MSDAGSLFPHLAGKHVLISGGGRSLGAALAVLATSSGAKVTITGRDAAALQAMANAIKIHNGATVDTAVLDMADTQAVESFAARWDHRRLDLLINNAAQWMTGRLEEQGADAITALITGNVAGMLLLIRGLLKALRQSGAGDIVNIVSISGLPNAPMQGASVAYLASKHGQAGLTEALRQELWGSPIRLTVIYPPRIEDISPLDGTAWNRRRGPFDTIDNRDVAESVFHALARARHVSYQSIVLESNNASFYAYKPVN